MKRYLTVIAGPESGQVLELDEGVTLVIGRGQASTARINDPRISRVHCQVHVENGKAWLEDRGSSSGTRMAGQTVTRCALEAGDVFEIGDTQIRLRVDGGQEASTLVPGERALGASKPQPAITPLKGLIGTSLGPYRLDSIIGGGDSGLVFKALDSEKNRPAAVKVLTPDPLRAEEQKERFVRAMRTMLDVHHPHIVPLYNAGKHGPYCWAAMELIDGESMTQVIARIGVVGMLDWREAYRVAVHIGRALQEAHQRKIIHRNVTPANILRRHTDKACLLGDLMLAKALEGTHARQVTQPGQLVGDVPYMPPERTRQDAEVDHRSDIYGLGATLYALLTGKPPFESNSLPDLVRQVRQAVPRKPRESQIGINEPFESLVLQMLAKESTARPQTPTQLLQELERIGRMNNLAGSV